MLLNSAAVLKFHVSHGSITIHLIRGGNLFIMVYVYNFLENLPVKQIDLYTSLTNDRNQTSNCCLSVSVDVIFFGILQYAAEVPLITHRPLTVNHFSLFLSNLHNRNANSLIAAGLILAFVYKKRFQLSNGFQGF